MTCANCGTQNDAGRKFCLECGSPLTAICPTCGTPNPPAAKFCGECATPLASHSSAARPSAPPAPEAVAERRLVSILFADLVGFTPFAEERDAEDVRDTLTRYFELARDVIDRYGGTIEKFIGDAVMAVWGAPTAREDDAERAVRAALDLVDAVRALGPDIQARAGVLTGEAAVTLGATSQGMVAGDLVNTASRLQSVAAPGTVLVGESTQRAAAGAIAFERAGEQVLKGKSAPVAAWRALRVVANRGGQGRSDLPEPPFVGRDEELRVLKDVIAVQSRDPRVRVVSITGAGGIGKSRLAWELEKYVDGLVETVYWHRGRSPSYGEGITFWALGEMVRRRAGLAESDDEDTTRARIAAVTAEFVPSEEDRRWVEPALLTLVGLEPPPAGGRDVLFAAWRIFFERIAAQGTTVLLFEDLQWADTGLLDFIDHVVEWARGVPLLIVTLARPELFERRPTWGAGQRHFTSLALEPLSDADMRGLLAGFVPGLPVAAVDAILGRADGIPLYAVETVRALVAEGRLQQIDGAYRPTGDLSRVAIPESLQSLIGSRLDALELDDRALVQDAAVLGQTFSLPALAAVHGTSESALEPRLRSLIRREILEAQVDPRSPERGQYGFVQSLIREVAYSTLARKDRRSRHLAVARYFESLGDDELAGALATHYLAAFRASADGPEADAIAIQARLALRGAAARAASLGAHEQAVNLLREALDVAPDPLERGEILVLAATNADDAATYGVALEFAAQARDAFRRAQDLSAAARVDALEGRIMINAGQIKEAVAALERAVAALPESGDDAARARILTNLSRSLYRVGEPARAVEVADAALPIAERLELEEVLADAFNNKAAGLSYTGRPREAAALMEAAVRTAEAGGFHSAELRARINLASVVWNRDPRRAFESARAAYDLARRLGNRGLARWSVGSVAVSEVLRAADWDTMIEVLSEELEGAAPMDEARLIVIRALMLMPRGDETDTALARMEELSRQLSDPSVAAEVHSLRAERALLGGNLVVAHDEFVLAAEYEAVGNVYLAFAVRAALWMRDAERVRALIARLDARPDSGTAVPLTDRLAARAGLAALEGRDHDALNGFRDVFRRYRDMTYDFNFARSVLDALRLLGTGDAELRRSADDARAIFDRVRARPYLALFDEAMAAGTRSSPLDAARRERTTRVAG